MGNLGISSSESRLLLLSLRLLPFASILKIRDAKVALHTTQRGVAVRLHMIYNLA
jgi:hypothetical protein